MSALNWQKSSFSGEAASCIHIAAADDGTIKLHESDEPDVIVTTTPEKLRAFILGVKAGEFDHFAQATGTDSDSDEAGPQPTSPRS